MQKSKRQGIAVVDMGTTNTRLFLLDGSGVTVSKARGAFGVKDRAAHGDRTVLVEGLRGLTRQVLNQSGRDHESISMMVCSGMATSEIGLEEVPHRIAPASIQDLAENTIELGLPEIGPMPIVFVPGIKNRVTAEGPEALFQMDFMRGEETQVFGAIDLYDIELPATFLFLSSHTKFVDVNQEGAICESFTTLSGQIFDSLRFQSLLASSLPADEPAHLPQKELQRGVQAGLDYGLQRAGLLIRFMDTLQETKPEERFAFLEGIVLASDLRAIQKGYPRLRERVYMLGNRIRSEAYRDALREFVKSDADYGYLGEDSMDESAKRGAFCIAKWKAKRDPDP